jgi:hypothetical protein
LTSQDTSPLLNKVVSFVIACRPSFLSVCHFKQFYHHLCCPSFWLPAIKDSEAYSFCPVRLSNIILWKKVLIIKINGFNFLCVIHKLLLSLSILSQNFESVKFSEGFIFLIIQIHFPVYRCGRPCDEFAERVWPIKISDRARTTLFNKGLVSCDVNQS